MHESTIFGVSIRGWIAVLVTVAAFVFFFAVTFGIGGEQVVAGTILAVSNSLALVLGFYFGQKDKGVVIEDEDDV